MYKSYNINKIGVLIFDWSFSVKLKIVKETK